MTEVIMKFIMPLLLTFAMMIPTHSHATLLNLSEVGGLDILIANSTLDNSGEKTEIEWLKGLRGDSVTLSQHYDSSGSDWFEVDGESNVFYTSLIQTPQYFVLKFGDGDLDMYSHYLFENKGDLSFAVFDLAGLGIDLSENQNVSIGRISHVREYNPVTTTTTLIPEPIMISLFSLLILMCANRKALNK